MNRSSLSSVPILISPLGYLFPCSPTINWLVLLLHPPPPQLFFEKVNIFLSSLFLTFVFVPLKFGICSHVPLKSMPLFPKPLASEYKTDHTKNIASVKEQMVLKQCKGGYWDITIRNYLSVLSLAFQVL